MKNNHLQVIKWGERIALAVVFAALGLLIYTVFSLYKPIYFLIILVPLAFAWGYIMQKTEGLWGSVLFHAGMDIPILLTLFSTSA